MTKGCVAALCLAALTAGCSGGDVPGTVGDLGEGVFRYDCVADGDARCNTSQAVDRMAVGSDLGIDPELPVAVAVGARFDLSYIGDFVTDQGESLILDTVSARTDVVTDSGGFVIEQPGTFAFLARSPQGYVADFVHLEAAAVDAIDIWHEETRKDAVELVEGTETTLGVVASSDVSIALAGGLAYQWASSDDAVAGVDSVGSSGMPSGVEINDDEVRLVAIAAGTATVTVTVGEISHDFTVTVTAAPPEGSP
jgi:hypothetical protein